MRLLRRGRGGSLGWAGTALAVLFLLGTLVGVFHHHASGDSEEGCALCALVHAGVITPPHIATPDAPLLSAGPVALRDWTPPSIAPRFTAPPRGPPSS